jgi:copper chaperone
MDSISLRIDGMRCGACIRRVTQALQTVPGGQVEAVRLGGARIYRQSDSVRPEALIQAVKRAGYTGLSGGIAMAEPHGRAERTVESYLPPGPLRAYRNASLIANTRSPGARRRASLLPLPGHCLFGVSHPESLLRSHGSPSLGVLLKG